MKVAYKAKSKRHFRIRFALLIGVGRERTILNKDGDHVTEIVSIYLPFCVISAIQQFKKVS